MPLAKSTEDVRVPQIHTRYLATRVASRRCSISSKRASHVGSALAVPNHAHGVSWGTPVARGCSGMSTCTTSLRLTSWAIASRARRMASSRVAASTRHAGRAGMVTWIPPSAVSVRMRVYCMVHTPHIGSSGGPEYTRIAPIIPPAPRARIHDASLPRPTVQPHTHAPAAGAGGHAASRAMMVEVVACRALRPYADGHGYNAAPMQRGDAAHGVPLEGSHNPDILALM